MITNNYLSYDENDDRRDGKVMVFTVLIMRTLIKIKLIVWI